MSTIREKAEAVRARVELPGDVQALAAFVLRVTAPEMKRDLANLICAAAMRQGGGALLDVAEGAAAAIVALLTEGA